MARKFGGARGREEKALGRAHPSNFRSILLQLLNLVSRAFPFPPRKISLSSVFSLSQEASAPAVRGVSVACSKTDYVAKSVKEK